MNKNLKSKIFTIVAAMSICTTLILGFTACSSKTTSQTNSSAAEEKKTTQEIVDMAGRKVTIPSQIKKVYSTRNRVWNLIKQGGGSEFFNNGALMVKMDKKDEIRGGGF